MKKDMIKKFKFATKLVDIFQVYAKKLDNYFENEENKINHKELYDYYQELINDIKVEGKDLL